MTSPTQLSGAKESAKVKARRARKECLLGKEKEKVTAKAKEENHLNRIHNKPMSPNKQHLAQHQHQIAKKLPMPKRTGDMTMLIGLMTGQNGAHPFTDAMNMIGTVGLHIMFLLEETGRNRRQSGDSC